MKKLSALFLLLVVFPAFVFAQTLDEKLREIDAYAEQVMTDWKGPGMAIAIVKDDKVVFQKGYGVRELGRREKVDENTLFAIDWRPSVHYNFPRGFVTFTIDKDGKTEMLKIDQPNSDFWFYELDLKRSK